MTLAYDHFNLRKCSCEDDDNDDDDDGCDGGAQKRIRLQYVAANNATHARALARYCEAARTTVSIFDGGTSSLRRVCVTLIFGWYDYFISSRL